MLNQFYQFADNPLPQDVWNEISQYLDPKEIEALRLVCAKFRNQMGENAIWQPLLNCLQAMDPRIPIVPPVGKTCREVFIEGFHKIRTRQALELSYIKMRIDYFHLKDMISGNDAETERNKKAFIDSILQPKINSLKTANLKDLELNHTFLDKINIDTLEFNMFFAEHYLNNAFTIEVTRLPKIIFEGLGWQIFWKTLKLFMIEGVVEDLPSEIAICETLKELVLRSPCLFELPQTIGQLNTLFVLDLKNNQLRRLPDSICLLTSLARLDLRGNDLEKLPASIDKLCNLKSLLLDKNLRHLVPAAFIGIELDRDVDTAIQEDSDDEIPLCSSPKRRKTS